MLSASISPPKCLKTEIMSILFLLVCFIGSSILIPSPGHLPYSLLMVVEVLVVLVVLEVVVEVCVLGIRPRALCTLSTCSTADLCL